MKTHSGSKKRFKATGSGLLVAKSTGKRHNMRKRTKKNKRHLNQETVLGSTEMQRMRILLNMKGPKPANPAPNPA